VQSPFFYFNCKATTSKKKRRERENKKTKKQHRLTAGRDAWRDWVPLLAVQHTDHYETRQQQEIMQIKTRQKIL
jgi:hypothetical protein